MRMNNYTHDNEETVIHIKFTNTYTKLETDKSLIDLQSSSEFVLKVSRSFPHLGRLIERHVSTSSCY